jgi:LacI family transcriptional regulator
MTLSGGKVVTLRDVAKESGFSPTTVSLVLNNAPLARSIPLRTQTTIKKVAQVLGYQPNQFARSLRNSKSQTVGVMVYDVTDPFCNQIIKGIEDSLYRVNYLPILTDIQNDRARLKPFVEMLVRRRVEGIIALDHHKSKITADLDGLRVPTVIIGRELEQRSVSSVVVDNRLGGQIAIAHLHFLGHRKIAFIKGPRALIDSKERWKGVCAFAQGVGLELDSELTAELGEHTSSHEIGHDLTRKLLGRERAFTALMAFDDMTAFGAVRALKLAGKDVPRDCSVIGFDDVATAAYYNPPLTTVRQRMEALGSRGVELLIDSIKTVHARRPLVPIHHRAVPELVVRESTCPPYVS